MNIRDIHIYQKLYHEKTDTIISVEEIHAYMEKVIAKSGQIYQANELSPIKNHEYTETDVNGHITLCIDTPAGQIRCDTDNPTDCGYTAAYLSLYPTVDTETIDLASVKYKEEPKGNKDLTVYVFDNIPSEMPNHEFPIYYNDICRALEIEDEED